MPEKNKKKRFLRKLASDLKSPAALLEGFLQRQPVFGIYPDEDKVYFNAIVLSLEKLANVAEQLESLSLEFEENAELADGALEVNHASCQTVLIIDDDAHTRLKWKSMLEEQGAHVIDAPSGESLLSMHLDYNRIQTALVDQYYENSDLDGLDIIEYLKRKKIARIHLCAEGVQDQDLHQKALLLGARSILPKPLSADEIAQILKA